MPARCSACVELALRRARVAGDAAHRDPHAVGVAAHVADVEPGAGDRRQGRIDRGARRLDRIARRRRSRPVPCWLPCWLLPPPMPGMAMPPSRIRYQAPPPTASAAASTPPISSALRRRRRRPGDAGATDARQHIGLRHRHRHGRRGRRDIARAAADHRDHLVHRAQPVLGIGPQHRLQHAAQLGRHRRQVRSLAALVDRIDQRAGHVDRLAVRHREDDQREAVDVASTAPTSRPKSPSCSGAT